MGLEFPMGGLADLERYGFTTGFGLAYKFHPHIGIRGDFDVAFLRNKPGNLTPPLTLVHYGASLEFDFPPPDYQDFPLTFRWDIGGGATSMSGDETFVGAESIDFSSTFPTLHSGMKIGYEITPTLEIFAGGRLYLIFADDAETAELYKNNPGRSPFGTTWSAPVTLGVKAAFQ